jgi:hypothetical protein
MDSSKLAPRKYGDKPLEEAPSTGGLKISWIERKIIDPQQLPPKQLTFDPGPLPTSMDGEIVTRLVQLIKDRVPRADQRPPEEVREEVMAVCERALRAEYEQKPAVRPGKAKGVKIHRWVTGEAWIESCIAFIGGILPPPSATCPAAPRAGFSLGSIAGYELTRPSRPNSQAFRNKSGPISPCSKLPVKMPSGRLCEARLAHR